MVFDKNFKKKTTKALLVTLSAVSVVSPILPSAHIIAHANINSQNNNGVNGDSNVFNISEVFNDNHADYTWIENVAWEYIDVNDHDESEMWKTVGDGRNQRGVVLTTKLIAIKGSNLFKLGVSGARIAPKAVSVSQNAVNRNFTARTSTIGGRRITFNASDMQHVLRRHHRNFWSGHGSTAPTLFSAGATPNGIRDIAFQVLNTPANAQRLSRLNAAQFSQQNVFDARIGNQMFRTVVANGRIVTTFPLR